MAIIIEKNREDKIIGKNISIYRRKCALKQEELAEFLNVKRELISLYENGKRQVPVLRLSKIADLFGIEFQDLLEIEPDKIKINQALAFKKDDLKPYDLKSVSEFRRIVKNYIKMKDLL